MQVRIFQPPKSPMQSGRASLRKWVMEFEPSAPREVEPLMGWTSSSDTRAQLRLRFDTLEEAIAYAQQEGLKIGRAHVVTPVTTAQLVCWLLLEKKNIRNFCQIVTTS